MDKYGGVVSSQSAHIKLPQIGNLTLFDFVTAQQGTDGQRYILWV